MALATRCPRCHTTFRVVQDQLKLYSGIVRCGVCQQVFNGNDHLTREEEPSSPAHAPATSQESPAATPQATNSPAAEAPRSGYEPQEWPAEEAGLATVEPTSTDEIPELDLIEDFSPTLRTRPDHEGFDGATLEQADDLSNEQAEDELPLISLDLGEDKPEADTGLVDHARDLPPALDLPEPEESEHSQEKQDDLPLDDDGPNTERYFETPVGLPAYNQQAIDAYLTRNEPTLDQLPPDAAPAPALAEPEFVKKAKGRKKSRRISRILFALCSLVLLAVLVLQCIYAFPDRILAQMPAAEPVVAEVCAIFDCEKPLSARIDELTIESVELQVQPNRPNSYVFEIVLRNRASLPQAWPHLELTLNDESGQPTVRRVLPPAEYLAETPQAASLEKGFRAESELAIKLAFALGNTKPAGYRAYIFYP